MICLKLFYVTLFIGLSQCDPTNSLTPCKRNDEACMTATAKAVLKKYTVGYPDVGIQTMDPLPLEKIVGDLSGLKFIFTDSITTGLSNCDIDKVKMDLDTLKLHFELTCKDIKMRGHYTIAGRLIVLPVEGDGDYEIHVRTYKFIVDGDLKKTTNGQGKEYVAIKKYLFKPEPRDQIIYDFKNLFNGQKDLAETVLKFANENWKEVADFVQEPVTSAVAKKIISNINKYFKVVPLNEMFID